MPQIQVTDNVKGLRESLELAQYIADLTPGINAALLRRRLQEVIDELDKHRPLGPDGKHGFLHTRTCGCKDAGLAYWIVQSDLEEGPLVFRFLDEVAEHLNTPTSDIINLFYGKIEPWLGLTIRRLIPDMD
jgi:hypothetical protein